MATYATLVPIAVNQIEQLVLFAKQHQIDLTVVGPELPLALGIVNRFREEGLPIFGPTQQAAQIESSKVFSKEFMQTYQIPTPHAERVTLNEAYEKIKTITMPIVLKVDGLAAGKGVVIAQNIEEARQGLDRFGTMGEASRQILLEQYLTGVEATFFVVADGTSAIPLASARDHKRLFEGNNGPNTGGMGAISPSPDITPAMEAEVMSKIVRPTLTGLVNEGMPYQGVLYVGLMLTEAGPFVLEFNARFGDPEAQAVLLRLQTDWIDLMEAVLEHRLDTLKLEWSDAVSVCVVLASAGYPEAYTKGEVIRGLDKINDPSVTVFHAGTRKDQNQTVTDGGRVLGVTAIGQDWTTARGRVYHAIDQISFRGMQYRKDIGQ